MINCQTCEHYDQANSYCNLFRHTVNLGCQSGTERKPHNHFEAIKAMSMEEMAVWVASIGPMPEVMLKFWQEWLKEEITDA